MSVLVAFARASLASAEPSLTESPIASAEEPTTPASLCVAQAERAQEFHKAGDVAQARAEVALCAQAHCPALVRNDCESWLHEWEQPITSSSSVPIDSPSQGNSTSRATPPAAIETNTLETSAPNYDQSSPPIWPWVAMAVGVAGGVGFAYWGINGRREAERLADSCGLDRSCRKAQVDPVRNKLIFADVSLGVGIAAFGAAVLGFLTSSDQAPVAQANHAATRKTMKRAPALDIGASSVTARFVF